MRISSMFPQFEDEQTLFVVCGGQRGIIYLAYSGIMDEVEDIRVDDPFDNSAREGFFAHYGDGSMYGYGSVLESKDYKVRKDFARRIRLAIDRATKQYKAKSIYLFVPSYRKNLILDNLTNPVKRRIKKILPGNYTELSPIQLLQLLESYYPTPRKMPKEEAQKILHNTANAH